MNTLSKIYLIFIIIFSFFIGCNFMVLISGPEVPTNVVLGLILDVVMVICNIVWFTQSLNK